MDPLGGRRPPVGLDERPAGTAALRAADIREWPWTWNGIDGEALPRNSSEDRVDAALRQGVSDGECPDGITASADAEDQCALRAGEGPFEGVGGQASTASASPAIERIASAARSNSSSAMTGVPSKDRSRSISTQERQPWYSSRTRTVTGRGMR